ncbi:MAG TPA: hypothetical protein VIE67_12950 [Rudaea sp.]|jgi:hypothetical protein|uniref:hypothetical protein n=1 Tax=Rudaea sp. TaxID=2136325 RepID=UPI002F9258D3
MSAQLIGLVVSLVGGGLILTIAILIRIRGPFGLVKNVDWERVSDPQALGDYVSLIMTLMGAVVASYGVLSYAFHGDMQSRKIGHFVFVVLMIIFGLALWLGQQRYQDKPRRDGRR